VPILYGTSDHWLARAAAEREMAANIVDPIARAVLLAVAENYEIEARRAEAGEVGAHMPNFPTTNG
jgi:hypothetical protein